MGVGVWKSMDRRRIMKREGKEYEWVRERSNGWEKKWCNLIFETDELMFSSMLLVAEF